MQHNFMSLQIALPHNFLHAYGTNGSVDAGVPSDVIVIVRASAESPAARFTQIPAEFLVHTPYVFVQAELMDKGTEAPRTRNALVRVLHSGVTLQLALVTKDRLAIRTLVFTTITSTTFLFWFD